MINFLIQAGALTGSKNLIGGILIGATTFFTNPGSPARPLSFDASVYVTQQGKIRLAIQKAMPGNVSITLSDQNKQVLYSASVAKKQLKAALQFDMSDVEDGTYTLEIQSADGRRITREVNVVTSAAKMAERTIAMQ